MLEIKKVNPPDFFPSWIKDNKEFGYRLREFMLETEQTNVCCYCEKSITPLNENSHIDHIRPRAKFPRLVDKYNNLVVSCQTKDRCGKAKEDQFSKDFIVPTEENPGKYLTYLPNGEIRAIDNNKKGMETIKILKLNAPALVGARRKLFKELNAMMDVEGFEEYFREYPGFVRYFKDNFLE